MFRFAFLFSVVFGAPAIALACASCGCTLSPDWEQTSHTGIKLDLRYDFIDQTDLRSGHSRISGPDAAAHVTNGDPQEVETYTLNRYVTASAEYSLNTDWKIGVQLPYVIRHHSTIGTASNGITAGPGGEQYTSNTTNLGDVRLFGRYQGFLPNHNFGILFGAKLPTGSFKQTGISTDPTEPGESEIDRGLQPGSGTADLFAGLYYTEAFSKSWDYFGEAIYQTALGARERYRPGDGMNVNGGVRYIGLEWLTAQVQLNMRWVQTDSGANSDSISTGGTLAYLSPGVSLPAMNGLEIYGFVQVPVYQYVTGVQLTPKMTSSFGVRYLF